MNKIESAYKELTTARAELVAELVAAYQEMEAIRIGTRLINNDLKAVTEQRDVAIQCHKWCYEDRKRVIGELTAVTEQRDDFRKEVEIVNERLRGKKHPDDNGLTVDGEIDINQLKEQRDRLAEALQACREDSVELLGERCFWQNEPRCDYQKRYQETRDNVTRADKALQSLTTNVQVVAPPTLDSE